MDTITVNLRIKEIREKLKLSQEEFSIPLNLQRNTISLIENEKRNPSDRTLNDICREFNVNYNWLITGDGDIFTEPETFSLDEYIKSKNGTSFEVEIVKAYFELDPKMRQSIITHFKERLFKIDEMSVTNDNIYSLPKTSDYLVAEAEKKYIKNVLKNAPKEESTALNTTEEIEKSI